MARQERSVHNEAGVVISAVLKSYRPVTYARVLKEADFHVRNRCRDAEAAGRGAISEEDKTSKINCLAHIAHFSLTNQHRFYEHSDRVKMGWKPEVHS